MDELDQAVSDLEHISESRRHLEVFKERILAMSGLDPDATVPGVLPVSQVKKALAAGNGGVGDPPTREG